MNAESPRLESEQSGSSSELPAISAADVARYSRLMGLAKAGAARTLSEHRAVIGALVVKRGGRIVQTTGDGVLIEFASVVDAVECAVALQLPSNFFNYLLSRLTLRFAT